MTRSTTTVPSRRARAPGPRADSTMGSMRTSRSPPGPTSANPAAPDWSRSGTQFGGTPVPRPRDQTRVVEGDGQVGERLVAIRGPQEVEGGPNRRSITGEAILHLPADGQIPGDAGQGRIHAGDAAVDLPDRPRLRTGVRSDQHPFQGAAEEQDRQRRDAPAGDQAGPAGPAGNGGPQRFVSLRRFHGKCRIPQPSGTEPRATAGGQGGGAFGAGEAVFRIGGLRSRRRGRIFGAGVAVILRGRKELLPHGGDGRIEPYGSAGPTDRLKLAPAAHEDEKRSIAQRVGNRQGGRTPAPRRPAGDGGPCRRRGRRD